MAWITPVTDRTIVDVETLSLLADKIITSGYATLTPAEKLYWYALEAGYLLTVDSEYLVTSDSLNLQVELPVTVKGALNAIDLNRIENNCKYLADLFTSVGYTMTLNTKLDWVQTDIPYYESEINRIRNNVKQICGMFLPLGTTPVIQMGVYLTYGDVNNLEISLEYMYNVIGGISEVWIYSGTQYAGE